MSLNCLCFACSSRLIVDSEPCPICSATQPPAALRKFKVKWRLPSGQWLTKVVIGRTFAEKVEAKFHSMSVEESILRVFTSPTLSSVWKSFHESKKTINRSIREDEQRFRDWLVFIASQPEMLKKTFIS
jgi:hypothetical protein